MSHHHEHHHDCCSSQEHCGARSSCSYGSDHHHHHHSEGGFSDDLLEVADEAWMELLKEKIKDQIAKNHGAHLDELAQIVSEANSERWKLKLSKEKIADRYEEKIENYFYR